MGSERGQPCSPAPLGHQNHCFHCLCRQWNPHPLGPGGLCLDPGLLVLQSYYRLLIPAGPHLPMDPWESSPPPPPLHISILETCPVTSAPPSAQNLAVTLSGLSTGLDFNVLIAIPRTLTKGINTRCAFCLVSGGLCQGGESGSISLAVALAELPLHSLFLRGHGQSPLGLVSTLVQKPEVPLSIP